MRSSESLGEQPGKVALAENDIRTGDGGDRPSRGELIVAGVGPGDPADLSYRAYSALENAEVIIGYKTYLDPLVDVFPGKEFVAGAMKREIERVRTAIEMALDGKKVVLVSGGDAGIYGMAGLVCEMAPADLKITMIPGITAASAVAAMIGAPLMHDFAVLSLSDLLTSWVEIERKAEAAFKADFVVVLYNPRSKNRNWQLERVRDMGLDYLPKETPVGVGWRSGKAVISNLGDFCELPIDMSATVVIGNSRTGLINGRMVTPRGYKAEPVMVRP